MAIIVPASWPLAAVALATACVSSTTYERDAQRRARVPLRDMAAPSPGPVSLERTSTALATLSAAAAEADERIRVDGTLASWVDYALRYHPGLRAVNAEWRAAIHAVAEARQLPALTVSYGVFARPVETRVGPQRQRIGVRQVWPWPEKRRAAADAATGRARADEQRQRAAITSVQRRVAEAYWQLWLAHRLRAIEERHRALVAELAETARARLTVGGATLADATRFELEVSRRADAVATLDARISDAQALLRQAVGGAPDMSVPAPDKAPVLAVPDETLAQLRVAARRHPDVTQHEFLAQASSDQERVENARTRPDLAMSVDYIQTGAARSTGVAAAPEDSGKDALLVGVSVMVPLWRAAYRSAGRRAQAQAASHRARAELVAQRAEAELQVAVTALRDSARRVELYRHTLIPQAESAYEAVLGGYHTGATQLSELLESRAIILELRQQRVRSMAAHAIAWARVEQLVGRAVHAQLVGGSKRD